MGSRVRSDISKKNEYWISKHRYYELRHMCLQYPEWIKICNSTDSLSRTSNDVLIQNLNRKENDPTSKCAEIRERYLKKINLIKSVSLKTDSELGYYVFQAVTKGLGYDTLLMLDDIPCCKDTYYRLYRKFFWLLNNSLE